MILRNKIRYWPKILKLHRYKVAFSFTQKEKKEAEVACKIFKFFLEDPSEIKFPDDKDIQKLVKYSLRQKIIKLIDENLPKINQKKDFSQSQVDGKIDQIYSKSKNFQEPNKQAFLDKKQSESQNIVRQSFQTSNLRDYFTIGGVVDRRLSSNYRFIDNGKYQGASYTKYLIFCPTYVTTHQLWNHIYKTNQTQLITGQFGIGKSYSALLFKILSDYIYKYRQIQYAQFLSKISQTKRYVKNPEIIYQIPKIIYLPLKQIDTKQSIEQTILSQCFQLTTQQITNIKNKTKDLDGILQGVSLKRIYQQKFKYKPFQLYLIFDQVGLLASCMRTRNRYNEIKKTKQYLEKNEKQRIQFVSQLLQKPYDLIKSQLELIKINALKNTLHQNFHIIYYLSSTDIEKNSLKQMNLNLQHKHMPISIEKLIYFNKIPTTPATLDFVQMIGLNFQTHKKLMQYQKKEANMDRQKLIQTIKQQLYQVLKQKFSFMTPLFIYKTFQSYFSRIKFNEDFITKSTERIKIIQQMIKKTIADSQFDYVQDFLNFLKKNQSHNILSLKALILLKLQIELRERRLKIDIYQQQLNQLEKNSTQYKTLQDKIIQLKNISIKLVKFALNRNSVEDAIFKNIFGLQYYNSQNIQIKCLVSFEVLQNLLYSGRKQITQILFLAGSDFLKGLNQGANLGNAIEMKFKDVIQSGQSIIRWQIKGIQQVKQPNGEVKKYQTNYQHFIYYQNFIKSNDKKNVPTIYGFIPIPQNRAENKNKKKSKTKQINESLNQLYNENDQFNFLYSFKVFFSKMETQMLLKTCIFYPLKSKFFDKINQIAENGINNISSDVTMISKAIDFVIAQIYSQVIVLNAYDICENEDQLSIKINNFLTQYVNFGDRYQIECTLKKGKKYKIRLNYIVLTPQKTATDTWKKNINIFFENENGKNKNQQIIFNNQQNFVQVKRSIKQKSKNQPLLLDKIVHLTFNDLQFVQIENRTQKSVEVWKKILQKWVYKQ